MLDNRIYTFLKLCQLMNYRKTAEALSMTQPAVTQHIQYLQNLYKVKLFEYEGKLLSKTESGKKLEEYARSVVYNEENLKNQLANQKQKRCFIGATKTIGNYAIDELVIKLLQDKDINMSLIVDNTKSLFEKLNNLDLDFLMIEGYFDKTKYDFLPMRNEELVGICHKSHEFAGREVEINDIFKEHLILREEGSGTREVLEQFLHENNYTLDGHHNKSVISSIKLIELAVENNLGISFVYKVISKKNNNIATFKIKNSNIVHEFSYVFLKNTKVRDLIIPITKVTN